MAYGNSTAGYQVEEAFVPYRLKYATKLAGTLATRIFKGNILVKDVSATEGVQNAADTANFLLVGIAADNQNADAAVGDLIEVYPPGSVLWLKTLDTVTSVKYNLPAWVDYGAASGTPQTVTIGTAGAQQGTNQIAMVGRVITGKTGYYLVDTGYMGIAQLHVDINMEIT